MLRLDADDRAPAGARLDHRADAREQSAAADRHDDRLDVRRLLEDLERHRALARDHVGVVERMDEREALVAAAICSASTRASVRSAPCRIDVGAETAGSW